MKLQLDPRVYVYTVRGRRQQTKIEILPKIKKKQNNNTGRCAPDTSKEDLTPPKL